VENFYTHLKELCLLNGGSGDENAVREYIISKLNNKYNYIVDNLGNLIVTPNALESNPSNLNPRLMVCAHMDEVSMLVTSVKNDGTLTISPVGGIDAQAAIGRRVTVGGKRLNGVIGSKAVHNMSDKEKEKKPEFSKLYVDIGADGKEEAERLVDLGDRVYFETEYIEFGNGFIRAKAIDDRFGCAVLLELMEREMVQNCAFVFSVQEEVGTRGAKTAAHTVNPDFALVIEATTAADIPEVNGEKRCCELGKGAVVPFMDKSAIYDKELYRLSKTLAEKNNINWQTKTVVAGGNDSGAIHVSRGGVKTISISTPCRYLHSPSCVVKRSDLEDCLRLAELMVKSMVNGS